MISKKLIIACLIILALFFFAGIGTGFVLNARKKPSAAEFDPNDWPWLNTIDSLLPSSGTPLDRRRLDPHPECQRTGEAFVLSKNSTSCEIRIRAVGSSDSREYQKSTLSLQGKGAKVEVTYTPTGEKKGESVNWPSTDTVRLVVFQDGGVLNLDCTNCGQGHGHTVQVVFE